MADVKISALTAITSSTDDDLLVLIEDPGGTPLSRQITVENFLLRSWAQITSSGGTQSLAASTWTKITQWTGNAGIARNATEDQANDEILVDNAGVYRAYVRVDWTNDISVTTQWRVYWNGATTDIIHPGITGTSGEISIEGIVDVTSGSTDFELWAHVDSAADVDVGRALMYVHSLGDT